MRKIISKIIFVHILNKCMKIFTHQYNYLFNTNPNRIQNGKTMPVYCNKTLGRDTVCFGKNASADSVQTTQNRSISNIEAISGIPCVYCGEPMLSKAEKSRLVNNISNAKGADLVELLFENKYLRGAKISIAKRICILALQHPKENIQQLLIRLAPEYKQDLETEQLDILRRIESKYSHEFSTEVEKTLFQNILYDTTQWINNESGIEPFKRKKFLIELKNILSLPVFRNRRAVSLILAEAAKMPQSLESENAFVVKYHRRLTREMVSQLFYEAGSTREHIKTRNAGGETTSENLSLACAYCNNFVRNNIPMSKFVDMHPEIEKNIRKNFNRILSAGSEQNARKIKIIEALNPKNPGVIKYMAMLRKASDNSWYTSGVAKTYMKESNGKLNLSEYINKEDSVD